MRADPTRIAAQIVTGIGFLGAGAIIRQGLSIRGLTTAATLWVVAAIGMAAGAGYYAAAVIGTARRARCALAAARRRLPDREPLRGRERAAARRASRRRRAPAAVLDALEERRRQGRPIETRATRAIGAPRARRSSSRTGHDAGARRAARRLEDVSGVRWAELSAHARARRTRTSCASSARARRAGRSSCSTRTTIRPRTARRTTRTRAARRASAARRRRRALGDRRGLGDRGRRARRRARASQSARFGRGRPVGRLLAELDGVDGDGRRARYVCELVALVARRRGASRHRRRSKAGSPTSRAGSEGFGYDPVFVPDGEERTVAELGNEWKARELAPGALRARCAALRESRLLLAPLALQRVHQLSSAPKTMTFAIT